MRARVQEQAVCAVTVPCRASCAVRHALCVMRCGPQCGGLGTSLAGPATPTHAGPYRPYGRTAPVPRVCEVQVMMEAAPVYGALSLPSAAHYTSPAAAEKKAMYEMRT